MPKKLRWLPHVINGIPVLVFAEFTEPETDPLRIKIYGQLAFLPEIDRYGIGYKGGSDIQKYADKPFEDIKDAMTEVEKYLFEEGIREDA